VFYVKKITISISDLRKLYKYALNHCRELCPAERDAETCILMIELGRKLGLRPPCHEDYGDFSEKTFDSIVKEIEDRYGKKITDFISETERRGPRSLQEQTDVMEGKFALEVIEAYRKRREEKEKEES